MTEKNKTQKVGGQPSAEADIQPKTQLAGFDLSDCFLSNPTDLSVAMERPIISVPAKKPSSEQWFRVHPDSEMHVTGTLYDSKEFQGIYLVKPAALPFVSDQTKVMTLYLGVFRGNFPFFFPACVPNPVRPNSWHQSAIQAIHLAQKAWVRILPNQSIGGYDVFQALGKIPDPEWPKLSVYELLEICFRGRIIDSPDHPIVQHLLGK
jgi:hypothetical protein